MHELGHTEIRATSRAAAADSGWPADNPPAARCGACTRMLNLPRIARPRPIREVQTDPARRLPTGRTSQRGQFIQPAGAEPGASWHPTQSGAHGTAARRTHVPGFESSAPVWPRAEAHQSDPASFRSKISLTPLGSLRAIIVAISPGAATGRVFALAGTSPKTEPPPSEGLDRRVRVAYRKFTWAGMQRLHWSAEFVAACKLLMIAVPAAFLVAQTDPPGGVGRLNYIDGPVSFQPAGVTDWWDRSPCVWTRTRHSSS
jgi:hypothetical protein